MRLLALDLATVTGFAVGPPGKIERSGSVRLKKPKEEPFVAGENIGMFLRDMFVLDKPSHIVIEAPLPVGATPGGEAAILQWGVAFVVSAMAKFYCMDFRTANATRVRQHYTGKSRWGSREEGKRRVIERARLLGHMPADCADDNRADACAVHDFASFTWFGAKPPAKLVLFGERAA